MTCFLALTLACLCAGGQAAMRSEVLRKEVGECAQQTNQMTFTQGRITGTLPSAQVVEAETDVVGADLIAIQYFSNYKILKEEMSKELYVLTQCGTTPPTTAELNSAVALAGYTVKHFTIPLQAASSSGTVHLAFFKALGLEDRITYVSQHATGPCWQKALGCDGKSNADVTQMAEVDAHFMDCNWDGTCDNVHSVAKGVHLSASQDPGPLRSAEHIKFVAAFFNKEELASQLFSSTLSAYANAYATVYPKPVVAWISFAPASQWGPAEFVLSQASYKLNMVTDAGGDNVDGAAVKAQMGASMSVTTAVSGTTYKAKLSDFSDSKADASAAFFAALGAVDVIIDETYAATPRTYTLASFLTQMGLTDTDKMVLRVDGTISDGDDLDWYESRIAHPDWAVNGLARQMHSDTSKTYRYFRNIAAGENPQVLSASTCTATLPACNAAAYPAPISMMIAPITATPVSQAQSSNALTMLFGVCLLLVIASVQ